MIKNKVDSTSLPRRLAMRDSGFTLIELVVVMAIIATLTALASFNFGQARTRARDVQRKSELKQIQNALELYKNDQFPQTYPTDAQYGANILVTAAYMGKLPVDPKEKVETGSWDGYDYTRTAALTYTLKACLENTSDPDRLTPLVACGASNAGYIYQLTQP